MAPALDEKTKQDMESGLEHAVRVVQTRFTQFEQKIFAPCLESSRKFSDRRPITAILISIFSLLSFLPVASFLGFATLVTAAFAFIGLAGAFIASTILIVAAASVLVFTLGALLLVSVFLTITIITLFVIVRLGQHLAFRSDVKQGFVGWARETRGRLRGRGPPESSSAVVNGSDVKRESSAPSGSDEWHAVNNGHT